MTGSYHATTFALVLLVCGLSAIPLCLPTPQTPATPSAKSDDDPDEQGRLLGGDETESDASVYAGEDKAADRARLRAERTLLVAVFSFIFLYCIAELSIGTWVPAYATIRGLTTPTEAAALGSWFWLCFTVGRISGICVSRWLSSIRMIAADLGLLLAAVVSCLPHCLALCLQILTTAVNAATRARWSRRMDTLALAAAQSSGRAWGFTGSASARSSPRP